MSDPHAERYRAFIEITTEGIWRFELETPVSTSLSTDDQIAHFYRHAYLAECNPALARMYGVGTADELVGARLGEFMPADDPVNREYLTQFIQANYRLTGHESHERSRDGQEKWFRNSLVGIVEDGQLLRAWGTQTDITQQKRAEAALKESEARFRVMADHAPVLVWVNGVHGAEFVNRSYLTFTGLTIDEALGMRWAECLHPEDAAAYVAAYEEAVRKRQLFESQFRFRRADGVYRWLKSVGIPRFGADGTFEGYVGCSVDVTDMKSAEEALQEANRAKDDFLAAVSHELRTPLNAVLGWTMMLRGQSDFARLARGLDTIDRNARMLARIVEDLLDFSRMTRGEFRIERVRTDLREVVRDAVDSVRFLAEQKRIQLRLDEGEDEVYVEGDAGRLQQVTWNLLANAIKFTPTEGQVSVRLDASDPAHVQVTVGDTGRGIRPELLPMIFDAFRQGGSTYDGAGGLGLGLAIVRHIVDAHGGTVTVSSPGEGQGATFVVRLPRAKAGRGEVG